MQFIAIQLSPNPLLFSFPLLSRGLGKSLSISAKVILNCFSTRLSSCIGRSSPYRRGPRRFFMIGSLATTAAFGFLSGFSREATAVESLRICSVISSA